jgi:hypothetical protein
MVLIAFICITMTSKMDYIKVFCRLFLSCCPLRPIYHLIFKCSYEEGFYVLYRFCLGSSLFVCGVKTKHRCIQNFFLGGGGGAGSEAMYNLCLILKSMLRKSCQNLRAKKPFWLEENIKLTEKKLHIQKFLLCFSIFQCTDHHPISVADLGWNVNNARLAVAFCTVHDTHTKQELGRICSHTAEPSLTTYFKWLL